MRRVCAFLAACTWEVPPEPPRDLLARICLAKRWVTAARAAQRGPRRLRQRCFLHTHPGGDPSCPNVG